MKCRPGRKQKCVHQALDVLSRELEEAREIRGYEKSFTARLAALKKWWKYLAS